MFRDALFGELYEKKMLLLKITLAVFLLVSLIGILIHSIEPDTFTSIFDGIWWAFVTVSTVGYGDFSPNSLAGRLLGILLMLTGIAVFSFFVTTLAASTVVLKEQHEKGFGRTNSNGHLVIIGWNEKSRLLIQNLHANASEKHVLLIDETLQKLPESFHYIRFIQGNPKLDETLMRANVPGADSVVMTASLHIDEKQADADTILNVLAVRSLAPDTYIIAELLTGNQVKNAVRAGADEVIEASQHTGMLLMNGLLYHGLTDVITKMLEHGQEEHVCLHTIPDQLIGKTFQKAIQSENTNETFLLGIRRETDTILHPSDDFVLAKNDKLIIVKR